VIVGRGEIVVGGCPVLPTFGRDKALRQPFDGLVGESPSIEP
jgi:hypothetical protein